MRQKSSNTYRNFFLFLHPNRGEWIPPNHHYFDETGVVAAVSKLRIFFRRNTFRLSPHLPFRRICLANNYRLSYTTFRCSPPLPSPLPKDDASVNGNKFSSSVCSIAIGMNGEKKKACPKKANAFNRHGSQPTWFSQKRRVVIHQKASKLAYPVRIG